MTSSNACDIPAGYYLPANSTCSTSYTQLDYIESSGTQYINTGVSVRDIYKLEVAFTINEDTFADFGPIFGGRNGINQTGILAAVLRDSSVALDWGARWQTGFTPTGHVPYKIVIENKTARIYNESTNTQVTS